MERITTAYAAKELQMLPNQVLRAVEDGKLPIGFIQRGEPTARHPKGKRTAFLYKEFLDSYTKGEAK